ncbi:MAG: glycosyltransferase 87 family protein [Syntrophomonadaceae bacterium]|nr:glycosyltransferase 87 family protein [Syntrophomonadaceae bacterium]
MLFHMVCWQVLKTDYPYATFLYYDRSVFVDFRGVLAAVNSGRPYSSDDFLMPELPPALILVSLLGDLPHAWGHLLMTVAFLTGVFLLCQRWLSPLLPNGILRQSAPFVILSSYPVLTLVERGNVEMLLFLCTTAFLTALRASRPRPALPLLALAISMKVYPAVMLPLLISRRLYSEAVVTAVLAFAMTCTGYALLAKWSGTTALQVLQAHAASLHQWASASTILPTLGVSHAHSLWAVYRLFFGLEHPPSVGYLAGVLIVFLGLAGWVIVVEHRLWAQVSLLAMAMLLLPYMSWDYTLIHVLIPLFLFLNKSQPSRFDLAYAVMLSLLVVPMSYYYFFADVGLSVVVYPLLMVTLIGVLVYEGYHIYKSS